MPRQGLTRRAVVEAAVQMIEADGLDRFSLRELARTLQVKPASLYNHVKSADDLHTEIGYYAIACMKEAQLAAIDGKTGDEAVLALAMAYYRFGKEHPELYRVILSLPMIRNDALQTAAGDIVEPIMRAMDAYELTLEQKMHLQRVLRSILHGFLTQEAAGCFRHFPVELSESLQMALRGFLLLLRSPESGVRA